MRELEDEYSRIVSNPDNMIMSKDLEEMLVSSNMPSESQLSRSLSGHVTFKNEDYVFDLKKIKRLCDDTFIFKGHSPAFPLSEFVLGENFVLFLFGVSFELVKAAPVIYKNDGILIFTAKRIINNETVSV